MTKAFSRKIRDKTLQGKKKRARNDQSLMICLTYSNKYGRMVANTLFNGGSFESCRREQAGWLPRISSTTVSRPLTIEFADSYHSSTSQSPEDFPGIHITSEARCQNRETEKPFRLNLAKYKNIAWPHNCIKLTPGILEFVKKMLSRPGSTELAKTKLSQPVMVKDLVKIVKDEWIEENIIDYYMEVMVKMPATESHLKFASLGTQFMHVATDCLEKNNWTALFNYVDFDFFAKEIVFVFVNVKNSHWVLASINLIDKTIIAYDSIKQACRTRYPPSFIEVIAHSVEALHAKHIMSAPAEITFETENSKGIDQPRKWKFDVGNDHWQSFYEPNTPLQMRGSGACGLHCMLLAEQLRRKSKRLCVEPDHYDYFRARLVYEILQGTVYPST